MFFYIYVAFTSFKVVKNKFLVKKIFCLHFLQNVLEIVRNCYIYNVKLSKNSNFEYF